MLHTLTPLLELRGPHATNTFTHVLLKLENTQPSGSFKLRGIGNMCKSAVEDKGATDFVCPSGGGAGIAAALAGRKLCVPTTVVVPESTPESVRVEIELQGAAVKVVGKDWNAANDHALMMCANGGATTLYVPPFDHPDIWDGNATMIDEIVQQQGKKPGIDFDVVICSVGGGGLFSGVAQGLHRNGAGHVPIIAVETEGAASLHAAAEAGELVTIPAITTIATTLGARRVAQQAFDWTKKHDVRLEKVSDAQAVSACLRFAKDMKFLVEPACGAALAVVYDRLPSVHGFTRPLVIVCGGCGVDMEKLQSWKAKFDL